ncbi:hypothetical protein [Halobellus ordinarius]|uniref:hypothetical protein n=1 Tax=Halobellus ordinarius TaxID=3075120 RepID=UPI0028803756|nr:hypothetical protein [Halobellus sp. ZY16]
MSDTVSTEDYAAIDGDAGGVRQHAPADVAPELYQPPTGDTGAHEPTADGAPTRDTTTEYR